MASINEIKNGVCIEMNDDLWQIVEFLHVKPGKGQAFVRSKMKSLTTGKNLEHTFQLSAKVVTARIERSQSQFLYKDDLGYNFMNNETFEQVSLPEFVIDSPDFLREGDMVDVLTHAETDKIIAVELPQFVIMEVTYTEPGVKGNTATNVTKPATVESGAVVSVPMFVNQGDKIKIDTKEKIYVERAK
ncbi:elongation factor P [soil metagenome]